MWPWYRGHCCSAANESWHQGRRTWPNCCKGQEWGSPHGRIEGRATGSVCELKVTAVKVIEHSQLLYNIHACKITCTSVAVYLPHSTLCSLLVSLLNYSNTLYFNHYCTVHKEASWDILRKSQSYGDKTCNAEARSSWVWRGGNELHSYISNYAICSLRLNYKLWL